jgi:hypothetical protein
MTIRLGYFEDFKGSNMLLIALDREDVAILRRELTMAATQEEPHPLHQIALVAQQHPARLFVCAGSIPFQSGGRDFVWRLNAPEHADADSKLGVLENGSSGHQYFNLEGSAPLIVSVGEYDADWWARVGGVTA